MASNSEGCLRSRKAADGEREGVGTSVGLGYDRGLARLNALSTRKAHPAWKASFFYRAQELAVMEVYRDWLLRRARSGPNTPVLDPAREQVEDQLAQQDAAEKGLAPPKSRASASTLTLFQANLLVARLTGFWARKGDGHPGPRHLAQGLMILAALQDLEDLQVPLRSGEAFGECGGERSEVPLLGPLGNGGSVLGGELSAPQPILRPLSRVTL